MKYILENKSKFAVKMATMGKVESSPDIISYLYFRRAETGMNMSNALHLRVVVCIP